MKTAIILASILFADHVHAESMYERDLQSITEIRDRDLAAATAPIMRKYKQSLEQLLQSATRNQDLETAVKIKAALAAIPPTALTGKKPPTTPEELKEFMSGTVWNITTNSPTGPTEYTLTFSRNGTFKHSDGRTGQFEITGADSFKMWGYDPAKLDRNFSQFQATGAGGIIYFGKLKVL